jgi:hypothetical protein
MSERFSTVIRIGGKIQAADVQELIEAINSEGIGIEWDESHFEPGSAADLLEALDGGFLVLTDHERSWGALDELEPLLQAKGIAYDVNVEGKYEYNAELRRFRPGLGFFSHPTLNDGHEAVYPESSLREILALKGRGQHRTAQEKLESVLGPEIPDLEPFEIVEIAVRA